MAISPLAASHLLSILVLVLCLLTAINVITTYYNVHRLQGLLPPPPKEYSWIGSDRPAQLPVEVGTVALELQYPADSSLNLHDNDGWGRDFESEGWVDVGPTNRTFVVSMVHQLHCLDVIRVGYLKNGTGTHDHIDHCLKYLRQAVLCLADTTMEDVVTGWRDGHLSRHDVQGGAGNLHRCRDWTAVRRYMLDHTTLEPDDSQLSVVTNHTG